jgi:V/A-type H+-transporting ATPase subunit D
MSMGLRYPDDAEVRPAPAPATAGLGGAATAPAAAAVRAALAAGVTTAAAEQAVRLLEAEVAVTRRRLRALDTRWLPSLQAALADLELSLAQAEQEDGVRLRRAGPAAGGGREQPG